MERQGGSPLRLVCAGIGGSIDKIIAKLAQADKLKGVIDVADFNDADNREPA